MSRFPLLEALRADRERAEAEASAPWRERARAMSDLAAARGRIINDLETAIREHAGKEMTKEMARMLARSLTTTVMPIIAKAIGGSKPEQFLTIPTDELRFMCPGNIEHMLLNTYMDHAQRALSVNTYSSFRGPAAAEACTIMRFTIPSLDVRHMVPASS